MFFVRILKTKNLLVIYITTCLYILSMLFLSAISHLTCSTKVAEQKPNFQIGFRNDCFLHSVFLLLVCIWCKQYSKFNNIFHCVTKISRFFLLQNWFNGSIFFVMLVFLGEVCFISYRINFKYLKTTVFSLKIIFVRMVPEHRLNFRVFSYWGL